MTQTVQQSKDLGKWRNPAIREENSHVNLTRAKTLFLATELGTVLDIDASEAHIRAKYGTNGRVTLWSLSPTTELRTVLRNGKVHF